MKLLSGSFALAALIALPQMTLAQSAGIGGVASLRKEAARSGQPLTLGDSVFQNETITTGQDSSVRITFLDNTNLAIGSSSRVTLDRFVFTPNPSTQEMTVNISRGAFRFTSGNLDKRAYRINTPTATMGVRGTVCNLDVGSFGTKVTCMEGEATVCSRRTGRCVRVGSGETVTVDARGNITSANTQAAAFTFEEFCAANATLCEGVTRTAGGWFPPSAGFVIPLGFIALGGGLAAIALDNSSNPKSP